MHNIWSGHTVRGWRIHGWRYRYIHDVSIYIYIWRNLFSAQIQGIRGKNKWKKFQQNFLNPMVH